MNDRAALADNKGEARMRDRFIKIFLIGLLCLFALNAYTLGYAERELDIDERWSIEAVSQSHEGTIRLLAGDYIRPPLYVVLLKLWVSFIGISVFSGRVFSVLFALWAIYLIYRLGAELDSKQEGLWAALLLTVSNFHLYYATEIRMYSMVVALSLLSTLWFFRAFITDRNKSGWYGYLVVTFLLTWTHILAWLFVGAQGSYLLLRATNERTRSLLAWGKATMFLIVLNVPWLLLVAHYWPSNFTDALAEPQMLLFPGAHQLTGAAYLIGAFNGMLPIKGTMRYGFLPWSIPFLAVLWQGRESLLHSIPQGVTALVGARLEKPTGYHLLVLLIPIAALTFISLVFVPMFIPRYLIFCLPTYYLLVSHCAVSACHKWQGQLLILLPALVWSVVSAASLRFLL
jgi:uncharacterized membrane protein